MLNLRGVDKRLGGRVVLNDVTLGCAPGEVAVITGENGSGKSTFLRIVVGLVEPDRGSVIVGGLPVTGASGRARELLGYLPDATDVLPELSVAELVALVSTFKRARGLGAAGAIATLRARLGVDDVWQQRLATLSFGQRKRALLLAALIGAPPLLVLDEPSNGLDSGGAALIRSLVDDRRRGGQATVVATNDLHFAAELGATRWQLADGRLTRAEVRNPLSVPSL
jgi:ABC-type multidrug transport system ATPase subunit